MSSKKAVVLLSGGIDSTTCLALSVELFGKDNVTALCLYYGQKHSKEVDQSRKVAEYYGVEWICKEVSDAFAYGNCTLLQGRGDIKHSSYAEQLNEMGGQGTVETYVPFRNGLFLSYAAAIAISLGASTISYGAHADDAAGSAYPDCSVSFIEHMGNAIYEGSGHTCKLDAPLKYLNKAGVVALGLKLKAPYHLTWSCYEGGATPCGKCGTCIDRAKAFEQNGVSDPAIECLILDRRC